MRRSALRVFFQRVLPVALPLMAGGCLTQGGCGPSPELSITVTLDGGATNITDAGCWGICVSGIESQTGRGGGFAVDECEVHPSTVECRYHTLFTGRRPQGFVACERGALARMAELEAASVHAFHMLACDLDENLAPASLIAEARRAARDEAHHARLMGGLAGRRPHVARPRRVRRSLEEIAVENVVEGCVGEAFGAAVAQIEAHTNPDAAMREAMRAIYPDEERHAELAFAVDAWIRPKLSRAARRRVDAARRQAFAELAAEYGQLRPLIDELAALA